MKLSSIFFLSHKRILPAALITPSVVLPYYTPDSQLVVVASNFNRWEKWMKNEGSSSNVRWFEPFSMPYHQVKERVRLSTNISCIQGVPSLQEAASYVNFLGGSVPTEPVVKQLNGFTDSLNILVSGIPVVHKSPDMATPDMVVVDGGFRVESVLPAFRNPAPTVVFQMTTIGGEEAIEYTNTYLRQQGYTISPVHQERTVEKITLSLVKKYPLWKGIIH